MGHPLDDYEDRLNEHENSHKLYDEKGHLAVNLTESQMETETTT